MFENVVTIVWLMLIGVLATSVVVLILISVFERIDNDGR